MPGKTRRGLLAAALAVLVLAAGCQRAPQVDPSLFQAEGPYDFPWVNPYVATVVRTPPIQRAALPERYPRRDFRFFVFPERPVPAVLWFHPSYRASLAMQPGRAPLVFVIAGTGSSHDSSLMHTLEQIFYAAGFHVLSLSSPTHPNFIVTGSTTQVPGFVDHDARDLYQVMKIAYDRVRDWIDVSSVNLAGYSLGGWHAAFVAKIDAEEGAFGFRRVLLINPPVDLYPSMRRVDNLLETNVPGGIDGIPAYLQRVFDAVARLYSDERFGDFNENFLYRAYTALQPPVEDLAALIGISFRLTSNDMAFSADMAARTGYLVSPEAEFTSSTPLTSYFRAGIRRSFQDYLDGLLVPFLQRSDPTVTQQDVIAASTLRRIEPFLATSPNIGLVTNADDIILVPGDIAYLRSLFGDRATIFPTGGHCGNYEHPHVVAAIAGFLAGGEERP